MLLWFRWLRDAVALPYPQCLGDTSICRHVGYHSRIALGRRGLRCTAPPRDPVAREIRGSLGSMLLWFRWLRDAVALPYPQCLGDTSICRYVGYHSRIALGRRDSRCSEQPQI
ncbi:hypothetical protein NDU88_003771 [Pleurodeles waltl]|uniref:Secreted protein n=1 Tax=Pleurodeles waltl TaxID=8319 RepID=A0AAV7UHB0_PLEWA|nr:hypothetical protein NDU88_003771 [Pleurodeles waltl]